MDNAATSIPGALAARLQFMADKSADDLMSRFIVYAIIEGFHSRQTGEETAEFSYAWDERELPNGLSQKVLREAADEVCRKTPWDHEGKAPLRVISRMAWLLGGDLHQVSPLFCPVATKGVLENWVVGSRF